MGNGTLCLACDHQTEFTCREKFREVISAALQSAFRGGFFDEVGNAE